jgi:hypothetical protein
MSPVGQGLLSSVLGTEALVGLGVRTSSEPDELDQAAGDVAKGR